MLPSMRGLLLLVLGARLLDVTSFQRAAAPTVRSSPLRALKGLSSTDKKVRPIEGDEAFLEAMQCCVDDKLVAIKFYASWCRACKSIAPKRALGASIPSTRSVARRGPSVFSPYGRFERLAKEFTGDEAQFFEIEFSANKDLCRRLEIKKLPCVQFFRGSEGCVDTVMCGPSKFPGVRVKLEELLGETRSAHDAADEVPINATLPEFTDVREHYDGDRQGA